MCVCVFVCGVCVCVCVCVYVCTWCTWHALYSIHVYTVSKRNDATNICSVNVKLSRHAILYKLTFICHSFYYLQYFIELCGFSKNHHSFTMHWEAGPIMPQPWKLLVGGTRPPIRDQWRQFECHCCWRIVSRYSRQNTPEGNSNRKTNLLLRTEHKKLVIHLKPCGELNFMARMKINSQ